MSIRIVTPDGASWFDLRADGRLLAAAEARRRAGRLAEAVACCRAAVAARPGDVRALRTALDDASLPP